MALIASISAADSQLNEKISCPSAYSISRSVFPTPAKTIPSAGKPASIAARTSFPLTQSAPSPACRIVSTMRGSKLAFSA